MIESMMHWPASFDIGNRCHVSLLLSRGGDSLNSSILLSRGGDSLSFSALLSPRLDFEDRVLLIIFLPLAFAPVR